MTRKFDALTCDFGKYSGIRTRMGMIRDTGNHESVWIGRYWLKDRNREGVPFSIWFTVKDGRLQGSTLEPNRFALISDEQLDASIRGHVNDEELVFLKSYRAF